MTKRREVLPAGKPRDRSRDDDALLLRSAESLGRVIGALQRKLDEATKRLSEAADDALDQFPSVREIADTVTRPRTSTLRRPSPTAKKTTKHKSTGAKRPSQKQAPSRKRAMSRKVRR